MEQITMDFTHPRMSEAVEAYLQTALDFTEYLPNGDPMSKVFDVDDFTANAIDKARALLFTFMRHPHVARLLDKHSIHDGCVGSRLWTLHTRQGIGFWDDIGKSDDTLKLDTIALDMMAHIEVRIDGGPQGCLYLEAKSHDF